nr:DUF2760 domain-containing protein [Zoogloeaceae bacterium]
MADPKPSLPGRISLAFGTFFAILGNADLALSIRRLRTGAAAESVPEAPPETAPVSPLREVAPDAALQLLALLQREARLVDFVEEDIAAYADADVGAAARLVHDGCRKALREHFSLEPVRHENEGDRISLPAGFDAAAIRVSGNVVGQPPFAGQLTHRGWRVAATRLPSLSQGHDSTIIAPAEVEL